MILLQRKRHCRSHAHTTKKTLSLSLSLSLSQYGHAAEVYEKLDDTHSLVALYVETHQWDHVSDRGLNNDIYECFILQQSIV